MSFSELNTEKVLRLYNVKFERIRERQESATEAFLKSLVQNGMDCSSPGLQSFAKHSEGQIKERSELYVESLIESIDSDKKLNHDLEFELAAALSNFFKKESLSSQTAIRQRCARCKITEMSEIFCRGFSLGLSIIENVITDSLRNKIDDVKKTTNDGLPAESDSGNQSADQIKSSGETRADIAILTALPLELDAFLAYSEPWHPLNTLTGSPRTYYHSETATGLSIVAASALGMGQINAALLARDVIDEWKPRKVILVGIAGGLSETVNLGDIVISEQIVDYELGKVTKGNATPRWSAYRSDAFLLDTLLNFKNVDWRSQIRTERPDGKGTEETQTHFGVVLSGNKVIADEQTAGALSSIWTRAAAIEMEAAGVAAALYQYRGSSVGFIMIKGICDKADSRKNDVWQEYAAHSAGAFTASLIASFQRMPIQKEDLDVHKKLEREPKVQVGNVDFRALRFALSEAFDKTELKTLVFDLGVDWDEIKGETKTEKIIELVNYLKRRSILNKLLDLVRQERPGLLEGYKNS